MGCCIRKQQNTASITLPIQAIRRNSIDLAHERFQLNSILNIDNLDIDLINIGSNGRVSPSWISFRSELGSQKQIFIEDESSCPICVNNFDESTYLPRILPCGHTMCNVCVMKMTKLNNYKYLRCPQDRKRHKTKFVSSDDFDNEGSEASDVSGSFLTTSFNTATYLPVVPVTRHNHMYQSSDESISSSVNPSDLSNSGADSIHTDISIQGSGSLQFEFINIHPSSTHQNVVTTWNSERLSRFHQSEVEVPSFSTGSSDRRLHSFNIPRIRELSDDICVHSRVPQVPTFVSNLWSNNVISESSRHRGQTTTVIIQEPLPDYSSDETHSGIY